MSARQGLPIGQQSFEALRGRNKLYVDKTGQLMEIADTLEFCFLSRPRRFGKSLMISTLEAMFQGKAELFEGLAAEEWVKEQAKHPCPVLHFDMSIPDKSSLEGFSRGLLNHQIKRNAKILGLTLENEDETGISDAFDALIFEVHERYGDVVVLIDEYDSPIAHNIDEPERVEEIREALNSFYQVLKGRSQFLRFVMVTGISKFSKLSIFSAGNNLVDISMVPKWGTIVGFTQEELEGNFVPWLEDFATACKGSLESVIRSLERHYDGFCFDGVHHVYNPWAVLNSLNFKDFGDYWYDSATTTMLVKFIKRFGMYNPGAYREVVVSKNFIGAKEIEHAQPESFLYQSGYLTIKEWPLVKNQDGLMVQGEKITLDYPNTEVYEALMRTYLEDVYCIKDYQSIADNLWTALCAGDIDKVVDLYNAVVASLPYQAFAQVELCEALFQMLFQAIIRTTGAIAQGEGQVKDGRFDTVIILPKARRVYVVEFKLAKNASEVRWNLDEALRQIKEKDYVTPYLKSGMAITAVAVAIDAETKEGAFELEEIEEA